MRRGSSARCSAEDVCRRVETAGEHVEGRYYAAVDQVAVTVVEGAADDARDRRFTDGSRPGLDLTALCRAARARGQPLLDAWPPRREYKRLVRVHVAELAAEVEAEIAAADARA